jgi:hypothetical protein
MASNVSGSRARGADESTAISCRLFVTIHHLLNRAVFVVWRIHEMGSTFNVSGSNIVRSRPQPPQPRAPDRGLALAAAVTYLLPHGASRSGADLWMPVFPKNPLEYGLRCSVAHH